MRSCSEALLQVEDFLGRFLVVDFDHEESSLGAQREVFESLKRL